MRTSSNRSSPPNSFEKVFGLFFFQKIFSPDIYFLKIHTTPELFTFFAVSFTDKKTDKRLNGRRFFRYREILTCSDWPNVRRQLEKTLTSTKKCKQANGRREFNSADVSGIKSTLHQPFCILRYHFLGNNIAMFWAFIFIILKRMWYSVITSLCCQGRDIRW